MTRLEPAIAWDAEGLWHALQPLVPGVSVEVVGRVASTNTTLLERARASYGAQVDGDRAATRPDARGAFGRRAADLQPCLLVAEHQSSGRGRHGRHWHSQRGASLTFSLSMPMAMSDWSGLSLAVGLAVAEALDDARAPRLGLKWPNDVWLADGPGPGRKLGGILIETVSAGAARLAIVGIGINILRFDARDASSGLAAWQEIEPQASAPEALRRIAVPLVQALKRFEGGGFAPFAEAFARRDLLRGQPVSTSDPACPEGVAHGVNAQGELQLLTPSGTLQRVAFGEVSVRPATVA